MEEPVPVLLHHRRVQNLRLLVEQLPAGGRRPNLRTPEAVRLLAALRARIPHRLHRDLRDADEVGEQQQGLREGDPPAGEVAGLGSLFVRRGALALRGHILHSIQLRPAAQVHGKRSPQTCQGRQLHPVVLQGRANCNSAARRRQAELGPKPARVQALRVQLERPGQAGLRRGPELHRDRVPDDPPLL